MPELDCPVEAAQLRESSRRNPIGTGACCQRALIHTCRSECVCFVCRASVLQFRSAPRTRRSRPRSRTSPSQTPSAAPPATPSSVGYAAGSPVTDVTVQGLINLILSPLFLYSLLQVGWGAPTLQQYGNMRSKRAQRDAYKQHFHSFLGYLWPRAMRGFGLVCATGCFASGVRLARAALSWLECPCRVAAATPV